GDAVAPASHGELQLSQVRRRLEPAYEPLVPHHLPLETGEVLALSRSPRSEELSQPVLAPELVPVAVVRDPEVAHSAPDGRGQHDHVKRRREGTPREPRRDQDSHRFRLAYVPTSWAVPRMCPCIAASTSFFWAAGRGCSVTSSAYNLKK